MVRMKSAKKLNKSFRKGNTPINICNSSIKFFGENANTVVVAVPSETSTCGRKVKEVAVVHEVGEESSSSMMKDTSSLIAREKSFIKIPYEHPRNINGLANIHEVIPQIGALSMVWAGIYASAGSGSIPSAYGEGYRVLGVQDSGGGVRS